MPVAFVPAPVHSRKPLRRTTPGQLLPFARPGGEHARFFLPELDALRFVAFMMVWCCHSFPSASDCLAHGAPGWLADLVGLLKETGNLGVPIFFFLSAYLITELLRREKAKTGTVALRRFYARRALRIWPLYFAVLASYGLLGVRFHAFRIENGRLLASVLMLGNWYVAFHPLILTPLRALWSLSVEEQFYALWPLLARALSRTQFILVCCLVFAAGQFTLVLLGTHASAAAATLHISAWVNSFVQFQYFASGALVAILLRGKTQTGVAPAHRVLLATGGVVAMLTATGVFHIKASQATHTPASLCAGYGLAGVGCVLLFFSLLSLPARYVPTTVQKLGRISFGLYVFHETGFYFASVLLRHSPAPASFALAWVINKGLALALTVGFAACSYIWWEKPFLRLKDRYTSVRSGAVA